MRLPLGRGSIFSLFLLAAVLPLFLDGIINLIFTDWF
jgi:hypothetical protein